MGKENLNNKRVGISLADKINIIKDIDKNICFVIMTKYQLKNKSNISDLWLTIKLKELIHMIEVSIKPVSIIEL
jgi:hypothetical protein